MSYYLKKRASGTGFLYQVIDQNGAVFSSRRSSRDYMACTIDGQHYFGRLDLIGKGDHGRYVKWCRNNGIEPKPIAYLREGD